MCTCHKRRQASLWYGLAHRTKIQNLQQLWIPTPHTMTLQLSHRQKNTRQTPTHSLRPLHPTSRCPTGIRPLSDSTTCSLTTFLTPHTNFPLHYNMLTLDTLTTRIQTELSETSLWELEWRIQSHPDKTTVTYFNIKSEKPRQIYLFPFLPAQPSVPRTKNTKILGLIIDDRTTFHKQISQKKAIASTTLSNLQRFRDCSAKTKLHLFKALILPHLIYCPLALSLAAKTNLLKLQNIQNRVLRFVLDVKWDDFRTTRSHHEETNILPLNQILHLRVLKQLDKFKILHEDLYNFINTLPLRVTRALRENILDANNHLIPVAIYNNNT